MKLGWMVGGLALLGSFGCGKPPEEAATEAPPVEVAFATAEQGVVRETVSLDGRFAPTEGSVAMLAPTVAGRLVKVLVREGDSVRAGQLLAQVDTNVQAQEARSAEGAASAAKEQATSSALTLEASRVQQQAALDTARLALAAAVAERDADVRQAALELEKLRSGARPQEIAQAEQAVLQAKVQRDRAKAEADRDQQLIGEGYVSKQQAEASQAAYLTAESAYKQAQQQLDLLRAGARREDIQAAEARLEAARTVGSKRVEQAQAAVREAEAGALSAKALAREAAAARFGATEKQAGASAARATQQLGEVRAPFAGRVSRRFLASGDQAEPGTPVFEIAAPGARTDFVASATPEEAARLSIGMRVLFPGKPGLAGTVASVGQPDAESGMIPVRVRCGAAGESAGAFASARIVVAVHSDVVRVPRESVLTQESAPVVFRVENGVAHRLEVEVGPEDDGWVEIKKGLVAGDVLVLIGQHELADGAKVVAQPPAEGTGS
ncbi:MAG: efflux RND transporter periplasmic adaptor subunit [Fimbriimonadaceae bacterium]|nr:efflux RND transporter periplasmic adaptor subunit [Fimbriimonadaceae bacterium]